MLAEVFSPTQKVIEKLYNTVLYVSPTLKNGELQVFIGQAKSPNLWTMINPTAGFSTAVNAKFGDSVMYGELMKVAVSGSFNSAYRSALIRMLYGLAERYWHEHERRNAVDLTADEARALREFGELNMTPQEHEQNQRMTERLAFAKYILHMHGIAA
jgi:hypothetical protein